MTRPAVNDPARVFDRAIALLGEGRLPEACALFAQVLVALPGDVATLCNLGLTLDRLGRHDEAVAHLARAAAIARDDAQVVDSYGIALLHAGRLDEALASFERAVALDARSPEIHNNRGVALREMNRLADAIAPFRRAVELAPAFAEARLNLGAALWRSGAVSAALPHLAEAVRLGPGDADAWTYLGKALVDSEQIQLGLEALGKALELAPDDGTVLYHIGSALRRADRLDDASTRLRAASDRDPRNASWLAESVWVNMQLCDWRTLEADRQRLRALGAEGAQLPPMLLTVLSEDPEEQRRCAVAFAPRAPAAPAVAARGRRRSATAGARLRVAYLSGDFFTHATAFLTAEMFGLHDRTRFHVIGVNHGPADDAEIARRLLAGFDEVLDARALTDAEVAAWLAAHEIDIAVDMKGHTWGNRLAILARRPAPLQVAYLGFPGTTGAPYVDYLIADEFLIPQPFREYYSERIVTLPNSYQVNDRQRRIGPPLAREDAGLPPDAFVYCSFNSSWKITPEVFASWMRILVAVPDSVLWLLAPHATAAANLARGAERHGVDPQRLVFAPRARNDRHLARYALADLFLDSWPCAAHTTASDSLWGGCPVLTLAGRTFPSRVAGSLLRACGLEELVTYSPEEYEATATALARDRGALARLRAILASARGAAPLFDTPRFVRNLERAYEAMWERHAAGLPPRAFAVIDAGPGAGTRPG